MAVGCLPWQRSYQSFFDRLRPDTPGIEFGALLALGVDAVTGIADGRAVAAEFARKIAAAHGENAAREMNGDLARMRKMSTA
jgi:hypothetical protein